MRLRKSEYVVVLAFLLLTTLIALPWLFVAIVVLSATYEALTSKTTPESTPPPFKGTLTADQELALFRQQKQVYLHSTTWKKKRQQALNRDKACTQCGTCSNLQVHHLRYTNLGHEPLSDLITLCDTCHTLRHQSVGFPQTYADYMQFNDKG